PPLLKPIFLMMKIASLVVSILIFSITNAQNNSHGKLKVYIDCRGGCDLSFFRSEITIVDFVLDRIPADAHVLLTGHELGGGGLQYEMNFYGQNRFSDYSETFFFTIAANATESEIRETILQYLMLGFSPLIAKTPLRSSVKISMKQDTSNARPPYESDPHDKWNFWVFRVSASGQLNADHVYKNNVISTDLSANRTTDKLKVEFFLNGDLRNSLYTYEDDTSETHYKVKNHTYRLYHMLVRSFSQHWSYGYQTSFSINTFDNYRSKIFFSPAIEYNVFKYKDVNSRFFVIRYGLDINHNNYYDTTIYNRTHETLFGHRFSAAITLNKKWGTFNGGFFYRNYFKDWSLNILGVNANTDVRIGGGLSFFVRLNASVVHNQVNLAKGDVTELEVLTRKRQLASNYNYYTSFGLAFRFGSVLNNFVNPRFDGYAGF
ncbi:MAG TPA: hypothetical protein VMY77_01685, partial [Chitinophagaceae bacterium]|nr:hypothetical protein [Chitinophagaceae bacterium]